MNTETLDKDKTLTTADFAAAGDRPGTAAERERAQERREPLHA